MTTSLKGRWSSVNDSLGRRALARMIARPQDPADHDRLIAANRAFADAMRPFGTGGAYLNFTPEADRVRGAYGDEKYERLVALKNKYDPDNVFRLNQNIEPTKQADELALA